MNAATKPRAGTTLEAARAHDMENTTDVRKPEALAFQLLQHFGVREHD